MTRYLSAREVAEHLGISVPTVYAYVSRGLLHSEPAGAHAHRYLFDEVEQLKLRREGRRNPASVAAGALHWGTPVLDSAITLIDNQLVYYRGIDVRELALSASIEEVASLIWTGERQQSSQLWADLPAISIPQLPDLPLIEQCVVALAIVGSNDHAAFDQRLQGLQRTAVRVLQLLFSVAAKRPLQGPIVAHLASTWQISQHLQPLLNAALIVSADHELNVSSFTARCVASAGTTLYAVVSAGLAALGGVHHGKQSELSELLLDELLRSPDMSAALAQKLRLGQPIPGFGHPMYPNGDPRGKVLLDLIRQLAPEFSSDIDRIIQAVYELLGDHPTIDFGLAWVGRVLNLPLGSAMSLFALGRSVGWIGHALEQYSDARLIRPRARYTGERPTISKL
ncbi:citrate/2-methylcitrate synthase [Herpetosiphon llansteffanensis]